LANHLTGVLVLSALIAIGKALVIALIVRACGWHLRVALTAGIALAQIGEFSFVVAQVAHGYDLITIELYNLLIAATVLTIFLSPIFFAIVDPLSGFLSQRMRWRGGRKPDPAPANLRGHVILCGYGRVGRATLALLGHCNQPAIVVDLDSKVKRDEVPGARWTIFGDISNPAIVAMCHPQSAALAILAIPDPVVAQRATSLLRSRNPALPIIARAHTTESAEKLELLGVNVAVVAEEEAAKTIVAESLMVTGRTFEEAETMVSLAAEKVKEAT
jgi:CPA2 family monovalent cation:H+ antiporter-2